MGSSYKRYVKWGGFLGLIAGGGLASAVTHDSIHGLWLLLWPAGLLIGLLVGHVVGMRAFERVYREQTGRDAWDDYSASRED